MLIKFPKDETPEEKNFREFMEKYREEGIMSSVTALDRGFVTQFMEEDGKWTGLAYTQDRGRDIEISTPECPTRKDAAGILDFYITKWRQNGAS